MHSVVKISHQSSCCVVLIKKKNDKMKKKKRSPVSRRAQQRTARVTDREATAKVREEESARVWGA